MACRTISGARVEHAGKELGAEGRRIELVVVASNWVWLLGHASEDDRFEQGVRSGAI
jgi:hypothetical protein